MVLGAIPGVVLRNGPSSVQGAMCDARDSEWHCPMEDNCHTSWIIYPAYLLFLIYIIPSKIVLAC